MTWMVTVRLLGAVRTSLYIDLIPVITVGLSAVVLHEPVTLISSLGIVLTLGGLFLFRKPKDKTACVFRIHSDEVARARELLKTVLGSKAKETDGGED